MLLKMVLKFAFCGGFRMKNKIEYGIKVIETTKIFPKIFNSKEEVEIFSSKAS